MTVKETAQQIKTTIDAITETVGGTKTDVLFKSWIGDLPNPPSAGSVVATVRAMTKEEDGNFNFPGNSPPEMPYWVPWEIIIYSAAQELTDATLRLYEVVDMVETALRVDLSFNGTCSEGVLSDIPVTYGAGGTSENNINPAAKISLKTYYTP